jgi:hypothetical protein
LPKTAIAPKPTADSKQKMAPTRPGWPVMNVHVYHDFVDGFVKIC